MRVPLSFLAPVLALAGAASASASELAVSVEIPRLNVAEYHRPYVAVWVEDGERKVVANLAVWYQQKDTKEGAGTKWLADLRQWWRRSGREQTLPIDGVSGATRPAGQHQLTFHGGQPPLGDLAPGKYQLVVEAAREVGGRELLSLPFEWPAATAVSSQVRGEHELGLVTLDVKP